MNYDEQVKKIVALCHDVKDKTYSPYSNFRVGAALLCEDGTIFTGVNVENASFGLTICAERTAIVKAVSEGYTSFKAIAISSDLLKSFIVPCGACRQVLCEFGTDWDVHMTKPDLTYETLKVSQLIPYSFSGKSLHDEKINGVNGDSQLNGQ